MAEFAFIDDTKELLSDVEKKVGKKGLFIILGGLGLVGLYLASKSFEKGTTASSEMVSAGGYIGYPEAEENADVIISEVSDEVTGTGSSILSYLSDMQADNNESMELLKNNILDQMNEDKTATNEAFENIKSEMTENKNATNDFMQELENNILAELEAFKQQTNEKFENLEKAEGEQTNINNSELTSGSIGGAEMSTDNKSEDKKVVSKTEVPNGPMSYNPNDGFAEYYEKTAGSQTTYKYEYDDGTTETRVKVDRIENEYGGQNYVHKKGDTVYTTKVDANGKVMEKTEQNIKDLK